MAVAGAFFSWNSVTPTEHLQSAEVEVNVKSIGNARGFRKGGEKCGGNDGAASGASQMIFICPFRYFAMKGHASVAQLRTVMIESLIRMAFGEVPCGSQDAAREGQDKITKEELWLAK